MKTFVGIDLGTTNSAICSYNGTDTRIWKSPEQNDVTPSAIFIDRRGNKFIGKRAYDNAAGNPDNSAVLFKRHMGTSTKIRMSAAKIEMTPEECSAEVLKTLFGYLPEEIRTDPDTGTVITVPAAFNQMQKEATLQAAHLAGIGNVALMQEPVAAVMSVMRNSSKNGIFLIFDLGGGTLDVAIAESINGRVTLLSHGGIAMCGGRDFDRALLDGVVKPWLKENFKLPDNFSADPKYKSFMRLAAWATERAKIELSSAESAVISLSENEARVRDLNDEEMYLDIELKRNVYNRLIIERINEAVTAVRETLDKAGITAVDVERIVFVGGPTNYKPLRDKVCIELGIRGSTDVNPMTAVAEGASIFAESVDWTASDRSRKRSKGEIAIRGKLNLTFKYLSRTPDSSGKVGVVLNSKVPEGTEFSINSVDTGWTSGLIPLKNRAVVSVPLTVRGDNKFIVSVFDPKGNKIPFGSDRFVITRTAASVDAIPASHSIAVEVVNKIGGKSEPDYLIRAGDPLPKKGMKVFKAAETLRAGSNKSLNIRLWEGEISDPVSDNRAVGVLKISGSDFDEGVIPIGSNLECSYEITDAGNIMLEVAVPCIGSIFRSGRNFYSRTEDQLDFSKDGSTVVEEADKVLESIESNPALENDARISRLKGKLLVLKNKVRSSSVDAEELQEGMETVLEARRAIANYRKENAASVNSSETEDIIKCFTDIIQNRLDDDDEAQFRAACEKLRSGAAQRGADYEKLREDFVRRVLAILWSYDWFVVFQFSAVLSVPASATSDPDRFEALAVKGRICVLRKDYSGLRDIIAEMVALSSGRATSGVDAIVNIMRG